jgi:putative flippase GtrA
MITGEMKQYLTFNRMTDFMRSGILRSKETRRFLGFTAVGLSGTIIDFTLLTLLKLAGLPTVEANTISFLTGMVNNFYWNRRWIFPETRSRRWSGQMARFGVVSLVGLLLNNALVLLLEAPFTPLLGHWAYLPAKVIATGIVVFWNFFANRFWTFREVRGSML